MARTLATTGPRRRTPRAKFDQKTLRELFAHFPSGLVTVAALGPSGPAGLLVATFTPVSISPPLVSVNIGRSSSTLPILRDQTHWGISVLSQAQQRVADQFRLPATERFSELDWAATSDGAVHVDGALATLTVTPEQFVDAGDHVIVIGRLTDHRGPRNSDPNPNEPAPDDTPHAAPLVFHRSRFRHLSQEISE